MKKVLVVAAHPDDEILGVGGTVAQYVAKGDIVECLILGEGQTSRASTREGAANEVVEELHKDAVKATNALGYHNVEFADFPDNRFDEVSLLDITKRVENYVNKFQPDIIYTHHSGDLNIDHRTTYNAVLTATRTVKDYTVRELYTFETLSSTEWNFDTPQVFEPNVYVDISQSIDKKIEAMKQYQSELCEYPHPRSVEGIKVLAKYRGMVVGIKYAEAFRLIRKVI